MGDVADCYGLSCLLGWSTNFSFGFLVEIHWIDGAYFILLNFSIPYENLCISENIYDMILGINKAYNIFEVLEINISDKNWHKRKYIENPFEVWTHVLEYYPSDFLKIKYT